MLDSKKDLSLIAERIRRLRGELRLTQAEFAEKLGVDQTSVSKWEKERARPTPEALLKLGSLALDIDKVFFLEWAGLPSQYLDGEPMIPAIREASEQVVGGVLRPLSEVPESPGKPQPGDPVIAARVKALRESFDWDQEKFARVLETRPAQVERWESEETRPSAYMLWRMGDLSNDEAWWYLQAGPLRTKHFKIAGRLKTSKNGEWDRELMLFVIETVDHELKKRGKKLTSRKLAELIMLFYDLCHDTGKRDSAMVDRLLKIA